MTAPVARKNAKLHLVVSGYIREFIDQPHALRMPLSLVDLIFKLYFVPSFDLKWFSDTKYVKDATISIDETGSICTANTTGWRSIFGCNTIDPQNDWFYEWSFRMLGTDSGDRNHLMFGIMEEGERNLRTHWIATTSSKRRSYCFYSEQRNPNLYQLSMLKCDEKFVVNTPGQEIVMQLDMTRKTLIFIIDGAECDQRFTDVDVTRKYRMGVSFCNGINKVQLF